MSSGRIAHLGCRAIPRFSRFLATAMAAVVMIAALGWTPDADGKRKSRNKEREAGGQAAKRGQIDRIVFGARSVTEGEAPVLTAWVNVPGGLLQLTVCDSEGRGESTWQLGLTTPTFPTLQIADVVRLVEASVEDEIIIRHIEKHRLAADLTADDLILLSKSGASTPVITALQGIPVAPKPGQPGRSQPPFDPCSTDGQVPEFFPSPPRGHKRTPVFTSEPLRKLLEEWERIWFFDQPDHATPLRTHGGII